MSGDELIKEFFFRFTNSLNKAHSKEVSISIMARRVAESWFSGAYIRDFYRLREKIDEFVNVCFLPYNKRSKDIHMEVFYGWWYGHVCIFKTGMGRVIGIIWRASWGNIMVMWFRHMQFYKVVAEPSQLSIELQDEPDDSL